MENEKIKCEHKWSIPVIAPYEYTGTYDQQYRILKSYHVYISCEKCGEIKKL